MSDMYSVLRAMSEEEFLQSVGGSEDGQNVLDEASLIWKVAQNVEEEAFNAFWSDGEMPPMELDAEAMEKLLGGGKKWETTKKVMWFVCF
jgi:hypothetical protein